MAQDLTQDTLFPRPDDAGYRAPDVCTLTGCTYRQLDYWTTTGIITASINPGTGSGTARAYSYRDLVNVQIIVNLLATGISFKKMRTTLSHLHTYDLDDIAETTVLSDGTTVHLCTQPDDIAELLTSGHGIFGIAIPGVINQLSGQLNKHGHAIKNAAA